MNLLVPAQRILPVSGFFPTLAPRFDIETSYSITLVFKPWAELVLCFILLWGAPDVQKISLSLAFPFTWNHSLGFPLHVSQSLWYWAVLAIAFCTAPLRHTHDTPETIHTLFFSKNLTPPHTPMSFWKKKLNKTFFFSHNWALKETLVPYSYTYC